MGWIICFIISLTTSFAMQLNESFDDSLGINLSSATLLFSNTYTKDLQQFVEELKVIKNPKDLVTDVNNLLESFKECVKANTADIFRPTQTLISILNKLSETQGQNLQKTIVSFFRLSVASWSYILSYREQDNPSTYAKAYMEKLLEGSFSNTYIGISQLWSIGNKISRSYQTGGVICRSNLDRSLKDLKIESSGNLKTAHNALCTMILSSTTNAISTENKKLLCISDKTQASNNDMNQSYIGF